LVAGQRAVNDRLDRVEVSPQETTSPREHTSPPPASHYRPAKLSCPTLSTHSTDPFVIQRHLTALRLHLDDSFMFWKPTDADRWAVSQCNTSIRGVGKWSLWVDTDGVNALTFEGWAKAFKAHVLDRGWESNLRIRFRGLKCLYSSPSGVQTYAKLLLDYQTILRDTRDPLTDSEVKHQFLHGLQGDDAPVGNKVRRYLDKAELGVEDVTLAKLVSQASDEMASWVEDCAAMQSYMRASQPAVSVHTFTPSPMRPSGPVHNSHNRALANGSPSSAPLTAEQAAWLNPDINLPPGEGGVRARAFLQRRAARQYGHVRDACPTHPPRP
ncbi:hypothetical protein B9479_008349, partial [Cryptococcus floricola]